jgi:hypothetical protein
MDQLRDYGLTLLGNEGKTVSDKALGLAALNARGHMRDFVKQLELIFFQGEEDYLQSYFTVFRAIESYFLDFSLGDKESVEVLARYPAPELRSLVGYFLREDVINPAGRFSSLLSRDLVPKFFANYLRLCGLVKESDDYFSVLLLLRQQLKALRGTNK